MHILGKNLQIVNRYTETAYFMQKIAESKSLIVLLKFLFLSFHAQSVRLKWL